MLQIAETEDTDTLYRGDRYLFISLRVTNKSSRYRVFKISRRTYNDNYLQNMLERRDRDKLAAFDTASFFALNGMVLRLGLSDPTALKTIYHDWFFSENGLKASCSTFRANRHEGNSSGWIPPGASSKFKIKCVIPASTHPIAVVYKSENIFIPIDPIPILAGPLRKLTRPGTREKARPNWLADGITEKVRHAVMNKRQQREKESKQPSNEDEPEEAINPFHAPTSKHGSQPGSIHP